MTTATIEPAHYRISALFAGLRVMWTATLPALVFIVLNAAVQAALTYLDVQSGFSPVFLVNVVVSALFVLLLYAVLTAGALQAVDRSAGFAAVFARIRHHWLSFTAWTLAQWLLILGAAVVHPALVLLVAALTPFLPLAAMDGQRNAIGANFRVIGRRFGRWLVTVVLLLIAGVLLYVLAAVNTFFVKGTPASAIFWVVIGLIAWWLLTAWALVYRSARPDAPE